MFELVLEFMSAARPLTNDRLREISTLKIDPESGMVSVGNKRTLSFIIGDISMYQGFEYNPDEMSIVRLEQNINELKQIIRKTMGEAEVGRKEKDVDMGMVAPSPSPSR